MRFVVFNANTGEAELVIEDKGFLTDYRTGVAGALATKILACSTHGEVHHGIEKGLIKLEDTIELGTLIDKGIKRTDKDITICDLVGIGFQDAVIGDCVYGKVYEANSMLLHNTF